MIDHIVRLQPTRVLDIGPGYGKWGFLVREALDFMPGRLAPERWQVTIDGVDAFPYASPILDWVYDKVTLGSALDVVDGLRGYDLVILGDVIEHFEKRDGFRLLRALLAHNKNVLISTPFDFFEQEIADNPYEQHLSCWCEADFSEWPVDYDVVGGSMIVVLLSGKGATIPSLAEARASHLVYSMPGMARRGALAKSSKKALARLNAVLGRPAASTGTTRA
ncbi:MAG: class I SAM-dependent methyltransferase [Acidimicrobiales bacterium]